MLREAIYSAKHPYGYPLLCPRPRSPDQSHPTLGRPVPMTHRAPSFFAVRSVMPFPFVLWRMNALLRLDIDLGSKSRHAPGLQSEADGVS